MIVFGIDTGSRTLECKWSGETESFRCQNNGKGHLRLLKQVKKCKAELVVIESTGGYERAVCRVLWAEKIPVAVMNPRWIRSFAKSQGKYAKNDRIDADLLVHYGERMNPAPSIPIAAEIERLQQLLTRRGQMLDMVVMEKNHEKAPGTTAEIRKGIRTLRTVLQKQVRELDILICTLIDESEAMKPRAEILRQQTGVGPVLLATLIADVPELGSVRRNVASALVGVAPFDADSGTHSGLRRISGGRARPRRALYMATLAAIRHDEHLKTFYKSLLARGKPRKVAIVACMRKLIVRLNSVLKTQPFVTLQA